MCTLCVAWSSADTFVAVDMSTSLKPAFLQVKPRELSLPVPKVPVRRHRGGVSTLRALTRQGCDPAGQRSGVGGVLAAVAVRLPVLATPCRG